MIDIFNIYVCAYVVAEGNTLSDVILWVTGRVRGCIVCIRINIIAMQQAVRTRARRRCRYFTPLQMRHQTSAKWAQIYSSCGELSMTPVMVTTKDLAWEWAVSNA